MESKLAYAYMHVSYYYIFYSGTWSPLESTGSIPPPSAASIITTDDHHAVLYRADRVSRNYRLAFLLDLEKMVSVKMLDVVSTFERLCL